MAKKQGAALAIIAMIIYVIGGLGSFAGFYLVMFKKGYNLFGLGDGRSIGFLFLCVGFSLTILGVLLMRIFRNRSLV